MDAPVEVAVFLRLDFIQVSDKMNEIAKTGFKVGNCLATALTNANACRI